MRSLIINLSQTQLTFSESDSLNKVSKENTFLFSFYPQINRLYKNTINSNEFKTTNIPDDCMSFHKDFLDSLSINNSKYKELEILKEQLFSYCFYQMYSGHLQKIACLSNFLNTQESFQRVIIIANKNKNLLLTKILLTNLKDAEVRYVQYTEFRFFSLLSKFKNYDFSLLQTKIISSINNVVQKNNSKFIFDNSSRIYEKLYRRIPICSKSIYRDAQYKKTEANNIQVKFNKASFYNFNLSPLYSEIESLILNFFSILPSIEKDIRLLKPRYKIFLSNSCATPVQVAKIFFFNKLRGRVLLKFDGNLSPKTKFWQSIYKYLAGYDLQVISLFNSSHQSISFENNKNIPVVIGSLSLPKKIPNISHNKTLSSNGKFIVPLTAVNFESTQPGFQKDIFDNIFYINKLLELSRIKNIQIDFKLHPSDYSNFKLYKSIIKSNEYCRIINKRMYLKDFTKYCGVISHSTTLALESFCVGVNQIIFNPFDWNAPHDHLIEYQNKLTTPLLFYCKNLLELDEAASICMSSKNLNKLTNDELHIKYESIMHNFSKMHEKDFNFFVSDELGL